MNRFRVPLVLFLFTVVLISGCAPATQPLPPSPLMSGTAPASCTNNGQGVKNPDAEVVCVDDSQQTLSVHPEPFFIHERLSNGRPERPIVEWHTRSGRGDLTITFADERCVRAVVCRGSQCKAVAANLKWWEKALGKQRRCKYDVELTNHPKLDPEGILTGCCMAEHP